MHTHAHYLTYLCQCMSYIHCNKSMTDIKHNIWEQAYLHMYICEDVLHTLIETWICFHLACNSLSVILSSLLSLCYPRVLSVLVCVRVCVWEREREREREREEGNVAETAWIWSYVFQYTKKLHEPSIRKPIWMWGHHDQSICNKDMAPVDLDNSFTLQTLQKHSAAHRT